MHIDSFHFGQIVIDNKEYTNDCIILGDKVLPDWWRKEGHMLNAEDINSVIEARPSMLIVGCGVSKKMKIANDVHKQLHKNNIELITYDTPKAAEKFNEQINKDNKIAAAFHLTC
jgi:hypothetical protein